MDLINIADDCLNKILSKHLKYYLIVTLQVIFSTGFREEVYNENVNLQNEIETQKSKLISN